jgi:hypothetical protein
MGVDAWRRWQMGKTIVTVLLGSLLLTGSGNPKTQYLLPVGCIGLSAAACNEATNLLRDRVRQFPETYDKWPEKWEIATQSELERITGLYPTREGHWLSKARFVLFLENGSNLHSCAPKHVIVTPDAIKSAEDMAYIRGYIDGACEGTAQQMLFNSKRQ